MDLYEALYTTRAMRRVHPDPIPEDVVKQMMDAAIRAPSGSNAQNWRWVVVDDRDKIGALAVIYRRAYKHLNETIYAGLDRKGDPQMARVTSSSDWLAENFEQVPLVIMPFHRNDSSGASVYPAVWNLMLAARGHGIGTTLTTVIGLFESDALFDLLDVPTDKGWSNAAAITCGYPKGVWGVAARKPVDGITFANTWGQGPGWSVPEPLWPSER
jgi:nitroreductase